MREDGGCHTFLLGGYANALGSLGSRAKMEKQFWHHQSQHSANYPLVSYNISLLIA